MRRCKGSIYGRSCKNGVTREYLADRRRPHQTVEIGVAFAVRFEDCAAQTVAKDSLVTDPVPMDPLRSNSAAISAFTGLLK
jgi:hypothetical protein